MVRRSTCATEHQGHSLSRPLPTSLKSILWSSCLRPSSRSFSLLLPPLLLPILLLPVPMPPLLLLLAAVLPTPLLPPLLLPFLLLLNPLRPNTLLPFLLLLPLLQRLNMPPWLAAAVLLVLLLVLLLLMLVVACWICTFSYGGRLCAPGEDMAEDHVSADETDARCNIGRVSF